MAAVTRPLAVVLVLWAALGVAAYFARGAWTRTVDAARAERPEPPEPVYTSILAAPYDPGTWNPRLVAGWDQVSATVTEQARMWGIDVDDPYTLCVMAAALVQAEAYAQAHPVTLEGAIRLHETAWKVRLRDLTRWDEGANPSTPPR